VHGKGGGKNRRSYRPTVEALEALRLLSNAALLLPDVAIERDVFHGGAPLAPDMPGTDLAWDEALTQAHLADLFDRSALPSAPPVVVPSDGKDLAAGHSQLNRYLSRAWSRAGLSPQVHDDATQAVFVTLLQNLGRTRFDGLLADIGQHGIRDVLNRETADGPDFFRAIDTVKKRFQRERIFQPIDTVDVASAPPGEDALALWRGALQEAIDQSLTPREASLIHDTLMGKTPAEIASQWGVAPKTVSNEKTRVIQKLRDAMVADMND
jgi:DNA-directed RNA polymerase specialized sigma24 family protein